MEMFFFPFFYMQTELIKALYMFFFQFTTLKNLIT